MCCRRCDSTRLIRLDKKCSRDNDVFRCQECGFLFSPFTPADVPNQQISSLKLKSPWLAKSLLSNQELCPRLKSQRRSQSPPVLETNLSNCPLQETILDDR